MKRLKGPGAPQPGCPVVAYLREPREKVWGVLLSLEGAGVWMRGINVNSFEDWARQAPAEEAGGMGLSTLFFPFLRVEKLAVDEAVGTVPSLVEHFERVTGKNLLSLPDFD